MRFPAFWASKSVLLMGIFIDYKAGFFLTNYEFFDAKRCILNTFLGRYLSVTLNIHLGSNFFEVLSYNKYNFSATHSNVPTWQQTLLNALIFMYVVSFRLRFLDAMLLCHDIEASVF